MGTNVVELLTPQDRRAKVYQVLAKVRGGTTRPGDSGPDIVQTIGRRKSGRIIPVELSMSVTRRRRAAGGGLCARPAPSRGRGG